MRRLRKKGQSSVEYATVIIIVIAALLAMQNYFKRSVQGRMRQSSDGIGEQYDPRFTESSITQKLSGQTNTNITSVGVSGGTQTLRADNSTLTETKDGYTRVDAE